MVELAVWMMLGGEFGLLLMRGVPRLLRARPWMLVAQSLALVLAPVHSLVPLYPSDLAHSLAPLPRSELSLSLFLFLSPSRVLGQSWLSAAVAAAAVLVAAGVSCGPVEWS